MNTDRRSLLKAMTLGSLATIAAGHSGFALARSAATTSVSTVPTLALVGAAVADSGFLRGIAASPAASVVRAKHAGLGVDFILELEQRLQSGQSQRVIGLTDDASATLIVDLARSAGARVHWVSLHNVSAESARHHLVPGPGGTATTAQLQRELDAFEAAQGDWSALLGYRLAAWTATADAASRFATRTPALTGQFVSFSIEA